MKLSCGALGARVVVFLIVISQMDGGMVAARRGAFLSTGGAFKISMSSNRGGNTEESRRLGEGAKIGGGSSIAAAQMCHPNATGKELFQACDKEGPSGCCKSMTKSYGDKAGSPDSGFTLAYKANYANQHLAKWLESGGKMKVTDVLGYQELTTFKFAKDLLKEGTLGDRLWKAEVSQSSIGKGLAPSVSYALMTSSADGTPYNFLKLSLSGDVPVHCKVDFGFRVDKCSQGCCCPAGIVKSDTALNDPNPEDSNCTGWVLQAQGVAAAFANKWIEKHPEVQQKVKACTAAFEDDARARQSTGRPPMCGPPPPPYCEGLAGLPSFGGSSSGNSELDLDDAQEMEDFRV